MRRCRRELVDRFLTLTQSTRKWLLVALLAFASATELRAQAEPPRDANYVASTRGRVYYWIGCSAWRQLSVANLRYFRSRAEAEAAGLTPSRSRGCAGPPERPNVDSSAAPTAPDSVAPVGVHRCAVERVHDGDTIICADGRRIRLLLIDTPELAQDPFGEMARDSAAVRAPRGAVLRLEFDVQRFDRYRRTLAYVYLPNGAMLNEQLLRIGFADVSVYPPNVKYVERFRAIKDSARAERRGLWGRNAFDCSPSDFRAGRCRR